MLDFIAFGLCLFIAYLLLWKLPHLQRKPQTKVEAQAKEPDWNWPRPSGHEHVGMR